MCIGTPMQVLEYQDGLAICSSRDDNTTQQVDMMLVGEPPIGSWVLVFLGTAREMLDHDTAMQISDALTALNMAMQGNGQIDHLFADLVDREPQLPDFLQQQLHKEDA